MLVVPPVPQPPRAPVGGPPRALLGITALHGVLSAPATTVRGPCHIDNQVGFSRVVSYVVFHSIVDDSPVILATRRPNFVACRARIFFGALFHSEPIGHPNQFACRVSRCWDSGDFALGRAAGGARLALAVSPLAFVHGLGGAPGLVVVVHCSTRGVLFAFVNEREDARRPFGGTATSSFCCSGE